MIMVGTNITLPTDKLCKVSEDYLFHSLKNPKPSIESRIRQLRIIYQLDPKMYSCQKRTLPYIVCATFNPAYRKIDNFAYTESFIVDIDKLTSKDLNVDSLRLEIQKDSRVQMCFTSPSRDGLKVMFRLKERCYDAGLYSIFYKAFASELSLKYKLEQVIDSRTSDVSRACFVSVDNDVYYNPFCDDVDFNAYVDTSNPAELFDMKHSQDKETKEADKIVKKERREEGLTEPEKEIMNKIKSCLRPEATTKSEKKPVFVPEQLEEIIDDLKKYIEQTGLVVSSIVSIQYAKKIHIKMGLKEAEINLFYGKRGFSIVKSPKCGTNEQLNELSAELIKNFIAILQDNG